MEFRDIDIIIEENFHFQLLTYLKKGEKNFFENREEETLNHLKEINSIVALGGGVFMNKNIRDNTKKYCISVWLDLEPRHLFSRIKMNKRRPLLNSKSPEEDIKIFMKRKQTYSLADHIDCNLKTKDKIVEEILKI